MANDYQSTTDQLFSQVLKVTNSNIVESLLGYKPESRWQGNEESNKPDSSKLWYRVSRQTVTNPQTGFGNSDSQSRAKYTNYGILFVQLFIPKTPIDSYSKGQTLAQMLVTESFRNKTTEGKIIFRNPRIQPLPPETDLNRINVVVDYEYDEVN